MILLFSSVWRKKAWETNRSAKGLLIATTTLDVLIWRIIWRIADDSPNPSNFLPAKLSRYTVHVFKSMTTLKCDITGVYKNDPSLKILLPS